jgi:hypothetical protein
MAPAPEPKGVLVISAWLERTEPPLVARITRTLDVSLGVEYSLVVTGQDRVAEVVRRWLAEFEETTLARRTIGDGGVTSP